MFERAQLVEAEKNGHLWVTCSAVLKWNMVIWNKSSPNVLTQARACLTLHVQLFDNCLPLGQTWNLGRQQFWAVTPGWQQSPGGLENNSKCITSAKCKTPPSGLLPSLVRHLRATYSLVKTNCKKENLCLRSELLQKKGVSEVFRLHCGKCTVKQETQ